MALEHARRPVLLALRGLGLGDLLASVPALRALRRAHPEHRFVLAAPAYLGGLLPLIGGVDELLDVSGPGPVPYGSPDVAVNLHGSGPESIQALRRTRPGRLLTHAHHLVPGTDGPPWEPETHERRRWCSLLEWHGIAADPEDLALGDPGPSPSPAAWWSSTRGRRSGRGSGRRTASPRWRPNWPVRTTGSSSPAA